MNGCVLRDSAGHWVSGLLDVLGMAFLSLKALRTPQMRAAPVPSSRDPVGALLSQEGTCPPQPSPWSVLFGVTWKEGIP